MHALTPSLTLSPHWQSIAGFTVYLPMRYAELSCRTHYSFLQGASHPSELMDRAQELGLAALAITDRDGVYGIPKAYAAWKALAPQEVSQGGPGRIKLITGAEIRLGSNLPRLKLLAQDRAGYGLMCRMISASHEGKPKGEAALDWVRFRAFMEDREFQAGRKGLIAMPEEGRLDDEFLEELQGYFGGDSEGPRLYLPISRTLDGRDGKRASRILARARELGLPVVATNDVHFHIPSRRSLQDTLSSIRANVSLDEVGARVFSNGERYLKSPLQMARLFEDLPEALWNTVRIADRCTFSPGELKYTYPSEWIPPEETAQGYLTQLVREGMQRRYPAGAPLNVRRQIAHEMKLIEELGFADYFLTIWEIVEFARSKKILCQGRGSAANSVICYCLGITAIDPVQMNLLFERFLSAERGEPPDIDVDFEHERREEVIQHIYQKYGRDRAGMVAAVTTYRSRSSLRDVSKALGLSPEVTAEHPGAVRLMEELKGFPRHLSIHSGGFTLSSDPIIDTVPIEPARMEGRTIVQWDKDDLAAIGLLKVDVLALGMLSCLRKCLDQVGHTLYGIPHDDKPTYDMICRGDTVGTFQIESRAQIGMCKRLLPRNFYDLVIEVAIVRPGPIVGQMVHPYLKRRRGEERVDFPHPDLVPILGRTLGVPLFQEQIMKMGIRFAGFTPGEADELRRAFGSWKSTGSIDRMGAKLKAGLLANGLPSEFVERVFKQIQGFSEYGFPESHAASFALLAYVSSYLKRHHPAEFTWALVNSLPMGFYSAHTLIDDVKRAGVHVFALDPNLSQWDCTLERDLDLKTGIRVGFRVVSGFSEAECNRLIEEREQNGPFKSLADFVARARISRPQVLEALAMGEAFACFGLNQRDSLWKLLEYRNLLASRAEIAARGEQLAFFGAAETGYVPSVFTPLSESQAIQADYASYGLSVRGHPMGALRKSSEGRGLPKTTSGGIKRLPSGRSIRVAGLVIARQRPPTAKGTAFATLEDEEGFLDLILHKETFERYRDVFTGNAFLLVTGRVQVDRNSLSLIVSRVEAVPSTELHFKSHDFY